MAAKKEAIEITCSECGIRFRLWIPVDLLPEWEKGSKVSCIRCGAKYLVKRERGGFTTEPLLELKVDEPVSAQPQPSAKDTILLIEDDSFARQLVMSALSDTDLRLIMAKSSGEALRIMGRERVNLLVTDLYLKNPDDPDAALDGEDLLRKIADGGHNIPAIITTGKDIIDDLVLDHKWFELHVKGFIQKGNPFWAEELKLKIKEVLYKD